MLAVLAAACAAATIPMTLAQNQKATIISSTRGIGTSTTQYASRSDGMDGRTTVTVDLSAGWFKEEEAAGPTSGASGYDGHEAWMRDLSGFSSPQAGGNKHALAVNQAYRNANSWWRPDHGGARIEPGDCGGIVVTPLGGETFEAWFDPATHRLAKVHENASYGATVDRSFLDYRLVSGRMTATRIETIRDGNPGTLQTLLLRRQTVGEQRPSATYSMPRLEPADWSLPPTRQVTLPFRLLNNHIVVEAMVNGKGPFAFLVDTGGHDILTPSTLSALGISSQGAGSSGGAGEKTVGNGYARVAGIDVGGAVLRDQTFVTLEFSSPSVEGLQLGGMLGVEFLERFVVRIDYGAKTITFADPAQADAVGPDAGTAVPFSFYEHMPQVQGTFDGVPARFNIDTGSRSEITLTGPFVERAGLRGAHPKGVTVTDGWGVGGPSRSYVVRADLVRLGEVVVQRPVAALSMAKRGSFSDAAYEGNIGSGLLKRFVVTFDYAKRTMYLNPLVAPDPDTGRFDRTGMWVNLGTGGVEIMDLAADGPAAAAGLRIGDVLIAMDGRPTTAIPLSDVRRMMKLLPEGDPVSVTYLRNGTRAVVNILPRNLLED